MLKGDYRDKMLKRKYCACNDNSCSTERYAINYSDLTPCLKSALTLAWFTLLSLDKCLRYVSTFTPSGSNIFRPSQLWHTSLFIFAYVMWFLTLLSVNRHFMKMRNLYFYTSIKSAKNENYDFMNKLNSLSCVCRVL